MDHRLLDLIATVTDACAGARGRGPGHPPAETVRVLATLRRFLREGTPWRSLTATADEASGSTLRRRLQDWAEGHLLQQVHAVLVAMLRGHPDLVLDSCSGRAKRGGDLTGPSVAGRAARAWPSGAGRSSAATRGCWRTSVWPCAMTASASSSSRCSRRRVHSWLQVASLANCDNRLLASAEAARERAGRDNTDLRAERDRRLALVEALAAEHRERRQPWPGLRRWWRRFVEGEG